MGRTATERLHLDEAERDVLRAAAASLARAVPRPEHARLAEAAARGEIPDDLLAPLEAMLDVLLQPDRAARTGGPMAEQVLRGIFRRTPRGARIAATAREVSQALLALRGQTIENLRVESAPGQHTLLIETDRCSVVLRLEPSGPRLDRLDLG